MSDQFFVSPAGISGASFIIDDPAEVRHIAAVMRYNAGDKICIFDGQGRRCQAVLTSVGKDLVTGKIEQDCPANEPEMVVTLACGLLKNDKFDWLVEKATELGVRGIIPLVTERTIVQPGPGDSRRIERWQKIVLAAAKQSLRAYIPQVATPCKLSVITAGRKYDHILVPDMDEKGLRMSGLAVQLKSARDILLVIGPEGGLSAEEITALVRGGGQCVSLGNRRLRAETAALTAVAALLSSCGEL
jgi:16S rRNA (uracil1498-N3)-methyltransferase